MKVNLFHAYTCYYSIIYQMPYTSLHDNACACRTHYVSDNRFLNGWLQLGLTHTQHVVLGIP
jgi:hypothetical protein